MITFRNQGDMRAAFEQLPLQTKLYFTDKLFTELVQLADNSYSTVADAAAAIMAALNTEGCDYSIKEVLTRARNQIAEVVVAASDQQRRLKGSLAYQMQQLR
ncbi:MAG TPA: hypothetical protein VD907_03230 [Verrucomicrobiae bacterium]|nr:hypothetical protein [Verrucomicrobiae bacterium]